MTEQVLVDLAGGRTAEEALTWGQHSIWLAIGRNPPGRFVVPRILVVPAGLAPTVADAVAALTGIVARHESLRSHVVERADGPRQIVVTTGRLPVTVVDAGEDQLATAQALARLFRTVSFDHAVELPIRAGLLVAAGRVVRIVLGFSHLAADWRATEVVLAELRSVLAGRPVTEPRGVQPVDIARREQAGDRRHTARAQSYWVEQFRRIPTTMFTAAGPPAEPACQAYQLNSPALNGAVRVLAARNQVSTSTVLLAATTALVGLRASASLSAMSVVVHNRFRPDRRSTVTTLNQLGLLVLDLAGEPDLTELIRRGWHGSLLASRNAYYDEVVLRARLERVSAERGAVVNPSCCFNDMRGNGDRSGVVPDEATIRDALPATRLVPVEYPRQSRCRFCLVIAGSAGRDVLQLTANTEYLPAHEIGRFLLTMERILVEGAFGGTRVTDLVGSAA